MSAEKNPAAKAAPKAASAARLAAAEKPAAGGANVVGTYIAEQAPDKQALLKSLAALATKHVPGAVNAIKWGAPFWIKDGTNICAISAFKHHVIINIFAPPSVLDDPKGRLEGEGANNRSLKVRTPADIDAPSIARWLKAAVTAAKG